VSDKLDSLCTIVSIQGHCYNAIYIEGDITTVDDKDYSRLGKHHGTESTT
jgi:hypothetical protein